MICISKNSRILAYACGYDFTINIYFVEVYGQCCTFSKQYRNNCIYCPFINIYVCVEHLFPILCVAWRWFCVWAYTFVSMPQAEIHKLKIIYLMISAITGCKCVFKTMLHTKSSVHLWIGAFQSTSMAFSIEIKCTESHFTKMNRWPMAIFRVLLSLI